jgi:hypothetical protein
MTMQDQSNETPTAPKRVPWNKGKVTGAKPPLRPKHVWSIRTKLQIEGRARDLAMFNLAIDSKLRVTSSRSRLKMSLPADTRRTAQRSDRRRQEGQSDLKLSEQTRQAVDDYLKLSNKRPGDFLFTSRGGAECSVTTRQYARLVSEWIGSIGRWTQGCSGRIRCDVQRLP